MSDPHEHGSAGLVWFDLVIAFAVGALVGLLLSIVSRAGTPKNTAPENDVG